MYRKSVVVATLAFLALSACGMESKPLGDPPPAPEVRAIAETSYVNTTNRRPRGLQVGQIHKANVFPHREDFLVCVSTIEKSAAPAYNNAGRLLAPAGTEYRRSYIMLMREYSDGWGAGIFRQVGTMKIGQLKTSDYCPSTERPW